ncbi:MAG: FAD:protein transferase [Ilumatobacteraceae bacterium]|nr:FAD:protein transferase [Ilumatobacteraceae bacterium]
MAGPAHDTFVAVHQPLLGTVVEVRIAGADAAAAESDRRIVAEVQRLEQVFSVYEPTSELSRWRRGDDVAISAELDEVLRLALRWQVLSGGAFNPAAGVLGRMWSEAAAHDAEPDPDTLLAAAMSIQAPRFAVGPAGPRPIADCATIDLNAIAKGYIVDRAVVAGCAVGGVQSVVVNAGGDLLHRGAGSLRVGIENPATPYDNAPPLLTVEIAGRGLATSGSARRGVRIGGRWYSHVVDPRTGRPVDHVRSASVIAHDATTADAVATVVGVLAPAAAIAFADALDDVSCCTVDDAGTVWRSAGWSAFERSR